MSLGYAIKPITRGRSDRKTVSKGGNLGTNGPSHCSQVRSSPDAARRSSHSSRDFASGSEVAKPRFYTDEHISKAVVAALRTNGVDVLTVPRRSDYRHSYFATVEEALARLSVDQLKALARLLP